MPNMSTELLIGVAIFVLLSVTVGTLAARLFMAAIRPHPRAAGDIEEP